MTRLIFVRHGQSESNLSRVFTGQSNTLLTPLGMKQAEKTAAYLREVHIDRIYASDLLRTVQTAEPTARMHGLEIIPEPAFREINAGDWEGKTYEALRAGDPEHYDAWWNDIGHAHPMNGEHVSELAARVYRAVDRILTEDRGKCVAIFTHATPVRAMGCRWFGYPTEEMAKVQWVPNASVSIAEYEDDGSFTLKQYGYDGHLGDSSTVLPSNLV